MTWGAFFYVWLQMKAVSETNTELKKKCRNEETTTSRER